MNNFIEDIDLMTPGPFEAGDITRGVCRHFRARRYSPLTEFKLSTRRRADVAGLNKAGRFVIAEVKSSVRDFQADRKWPEYIPFCDRFYFAVANGFPVDLIPGDCGILIADPYDAAILREAPLLKMNGARRRSQILRFAKTAADRLHRISDPSL